MRIDGSWHLCADGMLRPIIRVELLAADGSWRRAELQVDTGADSTVFSAALLPFLRLLAMSSETKLAGVGGKAGSVVTETKVRFTQANSGKVDFEGKFLAATALETLEISVLGRDITNLFAVIIDRPRDVVCLLSQRHSYTIVET